MKRKPRKVVQEGWSDGNITVCDDEDRKSCCKLDPRPRCYQDCHKVTVTIEELPAKGASREKAKG